MNLPPRCLFAFSAMALGLTGCITAAKVFFDIPEGQGNAAPVTELPPELLEQLQLRPPPPPPPEIEGVASQDSMLALLPSDPSGGVDWVAAVTQGVIRPRTVGAQVVEDTTMAFSYDIYLSSGSGPEAYFPHSTHVEWLDCRSCHPRVYRNGKESVIEGTAHTAASCGYCHGLVAFPIQACERCHEAASDLPRGRRTKAFGGTMRMTRVSGGSFAGVEVSGNYPPAVFPHNQHRLRFQCRACHEDPFPMVSGASVFTQERAHSVAGCGKCHDGTTAFPINPESCEECHVRGSG